MTQDLTGEKISNKMHVHFHKLQKIALNDTLGLCFSVRENVVEILNHVNMNMIPQCG